MSTMRWQWGDMNPVNAAVDSATVIEIGDLLYQLVGDASPASELIDRNGLVAQQSFADNFLGVAMQRSRSGDTTPVRVATTGVFEFDCPASTFELGDLMGIWHDKQLKNQGIDQVSRTTPHLAIARVAVRRATVTTSVSVAIRSTVMTGGIITR